MSRRERTDAARNREALLTAARTLFAEQGPDVALGMIADAAGVSRTTLYRNFATREDLAATVLAENVAVIEARALELDGAPDGLVSLLDFVFDMQARNRSVTRVLSAEDQRLVALATRTTAAFGPLVEQARGILHEHVQARDVLLTLQMAEVAAADAESFARARAILRRGLVRRDQP